MPNNNPHLLVIRLSAMGDVAMSAHVLKSLREANPNLKITMLTRPFFKPFFREVAKMGELGDCADVQSPQKCGFDIITPDFEGRHKGVVGLIRLYRDIRACGVTHVVDLHDVLRTRLLRPLLRLSCRVSVLDKGKAEKRALTRKYQKVLKPLTPTVERYRKAIEQLGFTVPEPKPVENIPLPIPEQILKITGDKSGVWVGVAPFAQHQGKIYPTPQTDKLISLLSERYEHVFVFGGGPYEREFAEEMEKRHKGVVSVIGKIKLNAELDLISSLETIVTMDSAAMHMASLVGTPVVSIWGATHPYAGFYGFGQDPDNIIQLDMACRPCSVYGNKPCLFKDYRCMVRIKPESVVKQVEKVVEQRKDNLQEREE